MAKLSNIRKQLLMNRKWFALYTKPRWEKKVNQLLNQKGVEFG